MPDEYKSIKKIVNRIAKNNNLGNQPITFSINTGYDAYWIAEGLNLCKKDECLFYQRLNPFNTYTGKNKTQINEIIRQSYLYSSIEGYAYSHGLITISRASFSLLANKKDFLGCLIAHELVHFLNHDSFKNSLKLGIEGKGLSEEKISNLEMKISRESESNADVGAIKMLARSGYPLDTCIKELEWSYRLAGLGGPTEEDSTHPGYEDRHTFMKNFVENFNVNSIKETKIETKIKWKYNRDLNTLRFIPY
tara:strand:- start:13210 stop:13959 length:750 start_codon:yes stop_codon:yes gene_type:complete